MKRTILILAIFSLVISASLSAQVRDFTGKSWVSGNLGYAFGTGDAFSSYTEPFTNTKISSGAGIGFGGQYFYGIRHKLLIGGELMFQSYSVEISRPPNLALGIQPYEMSESEIETNIIVNTLYGINQTRNSDLFLMGGTGFYDFDGMEFGLSSGLFWRSQVSPTVHLFGMPRLHIVLADNTPIMFQLTMGAQFSL
jgi:hypothetical protein